MRAGDHAAAALPLPEVGLQSFAGAASGPERPGAQDEVRPACVWLERHDTCLYFESLPMIRVDGGRPL